MNLTIFNAASAGMYIVQVTVEGHARARTADCSFSLVSHSTLPTSARHENV